MPVIQFDVGDLNRLVGKSLKAEEVATRLPMIGGDLDHRDGDEVTIEFFPNRPDLLSVEGVARAARAFFDVAPGLASYEVVEGKEEVVIDPAVAKVRPFIGFARVDGLRLDAVRLRGLIDLQERLTMGLGRKRKKVAIGIHDAKDVAAPFAYKAVGWEEVSFAPLGYTRPMTPKQIVEDHEKGRLYGPLVAGGDTVPMILDRDGKVLSFPPVINGVLTQLSEGTTDVLVDVTGTDEAAVMGTLNIVVAALAERGGTITSLRHRHGKKKAFVAPDLSPREWTFSRAYAESLLGLTLDDKTLRRSLGRMGHDVAAVDGDDVGVRVGAWRVDLIHPVDLVEEVAIGYGFDAFEPTLPTRAMFGSQRPASHAASRARTLLLGHGFTEAVSLTLTGRRDHFEALGSSGVEVAEVTNPVTQEQAVLRAWLWPSLMALLRANKHNQLPQDVFEVGIVVPPVEEGMAPHNELRAAAVRVASRAGFSQAKSVAEAFLRDAGIKAEMAPGRVPGLVEGRTAILRDGRDEIGFVGEVDPRTLGAFELEAPAFAFEVVLDPKPSMD